MTMHIVRGLTTAGRKKSKQKWASAEQKRQSMQLEQEWQTLNNKWTPSVSVKNSTAKNKPVAHTHRDSNKEKIASLDTNVQGAVTIKKTPHYTGNQILGVTVLHKSCLQPVFNRQEAIDAASMRR